MHKKNQNLAVFIAGIVASGTWLHGQTPPEATKVAEGAGAPSVAAPATLNNGSSGGGGGLNLLKMFDPQSGNVTWQGKTFGMGESKVLLARFERYLVTPEANGAADIAYNQTLDDISDTLKGRKGGSVEQRLAEAWRLLYKAAD